MLSVEPEELDLAGFEQLVADARGAVPKTAAARLREALALWRGPALADLAYESFAQVEIARLEELRLTVLEQRIEADLALGRHAELVGELEALVTRFPLREPLRGQLMLALYRAGRQAEALDAYRAARRELVEELGLEPSEELQRLEQAILQHEPALAPPREAEHGSAQAAPQPVVLSRALLVVPTELAGLDGLLALAEPLASGSQPPRELIVAAVVPAAELERATALLAARRDRLLAAGVAARTAAFSSPSRGEDIARLASQENVDLLLLDAGPEPLGGDAAAVLEQAPLRRGAADGSGRPLRDGPVMVPFGGGQPRLGGAGARRLGRGRRRRAAAADRRCRSAQAQTRCKPAARRRVADRAAARRESWPSRSWGAPVGAE